MFYVSQPHNFIQNLYATAHGEEWKRTESDLEKCKQTRIVGNKKPAEEAEKEGVDGWLLDKCPRNSYKLQCGTNQLDRFRPKF